MNRTFSRVATQKIGRSVFDLSYSKKFTCDMGELIPVYIEEVVPGDIINYGIQGVIRLQPLVAPVLHAVYARFHTFYCPYRIVWENDSPVTGSWESLITRGEDGTEAPTIPTWNGGGDVTVGSLWDYLEYPTGIVPGAGGLPVAFPLYVYNKIYNTYYRDETQITEVALTSNTVKKPAWMKDYFTSALPWQSRGTPPALPITGVADVDAKDETITMKNTTDATARQVSTSVASDVVLGSAPSGTAAARWVSTGMEVDFSNAVAFDMADLRLTAQVTRWLERNQRSGGRYIEQIKAHFNVAPRDERLQRPEYLGGMKMPVIFSEVLQTESSDASTPQGTMAGHGVAVGNKHICKYRVKEHGIIMTIMSVLPVTAYSQGVDKQWLKSTVYDYYFPEFAHLSEQAVTHAEIYTSATPADNTSIFGYQGRYNEMRCRQNKIAGDMRSTYDYWHLGRQFGSKPSLNQAFIEADPRKDIFAAPSVDGLICNIGNRVKAIRPMPIEPVPGLIDH